MRNTYPSLPDKTLVEFTVGSTIVSGIIHCKSLSKWILHNDSRIQTNPTTIKPDNLQGYKYYIGYWDDRIENVQEAKPVPPELINEYFPWHLRRKNANSL